jgi:hypothetical protein
VIFLWGKEQRMPPIQSVSFAAAAFNAVYYVGVLHYLQTHAHRLAPGCLFLGSSSGSVMGPLLVCGVGVDRLVGRLVPFLRESHRLKNFWASSRRFLRTVFGLLPPDAHRRCSRRCVVVYTKITLDTVASVRRSRFRSNRELFRYIRASCCIPLVTDTGAIKLGRGHYGVDGTFSDSQPVVDHHTLRINATQQRGDGADIYPPQNVTSAHPALMELPPMHKVRAILAQGYADARHYLERLAPPLFRGPRSSRRQKSPVGGEDAPQPELPPLPLPVREWNG